MDGSLPFIMLRQNDWVQQIRYAAAWIFDDRLTRLSDSEFIFSLPFAEKLRRSSRGSHGEYTDEFFALLCSPKYKKALDAGLLDSCVRTRRICIRAILSMPELDNPQVECQLMAEPDPFLRSLLLRGLIERDAMTPRIAEHVLILCISSS